MAINGTLNSFPVAQTYDMLLEIDVDNAVEIPE